MVERIDDTAEGARRLRELIAECKRAVVFTGAGISTESGIPDFRSPQGIWSKTTPILWNEFMASEDARREAWRRKFAMEQEIGAIEPNAGHRALTKLHRIGKLSHIITQNIDGLHVASGMPADRVIELHGNGTYATCLDCGARCELADIKRGFVGEGKLPVCDGCGGIVKSATISFGQAMPEAAMTRAHEESLACDLFIAVGSSLVVYPAAGFPLVAKKTGATLVILNREPTPLDDDADLVINAEIGPILKRVVPMN